MQKKFLRIRRMSGDLLGRAFFGGAIRDKTTKESRKAADAVATFKRKMRNPAAFAPGASAKMPKQEDLAKACLHVKSTLPAELADRVVGSVDVNAAAAAAATRGSSSSFQRGGGGDKGGQYDFMEREAQADVFRRMHDLAKRGDRFDSEAHYVHSAEDAREAELIIQGRDPATVHSTERMVQQRKIPVLKRHFYASMGHRHYMTPMGVAYVHTDGSVAIFRHGQANECPCGAIHMA